MDIKTRAKAMVEQYGWPLVITCGCIDLFLIWAVVAGVMSL